LRPGANFPLPRFLRSVFSSPPPFLSSSGTGGPLPLFSPNFDHLMKDTQSPPFFFPFPFLYQFSSFPFPFQTPNRQLVIERSSGTLATNSLHFLFPFFSLSIDKEPGIEKKPRHSFFPPLPLSVIICAYNGCRHRLPPFPFSVEETVRHSPPFSRTEWVVHSPFSSLPGMRFRPTSLPSRYRRLPSSLLRSA